MTQIIRVFPRKTRASPIDEMAYFGPPHWYSEADEVHISVTFTWDKLRAEQLAEQWARVAPVKIGGPAYDDLGLEFVPGRYLRPGYTITSRGCPKRCWFCKVWKTNPVPRVLPITPGWNVLDDNILACPRQHVEAVFAMLGRQERRCTFTGGLDATLLDDWHVERLARLVRKPTCYFAYDPGDELEPLAVATRKMVSAGFTATSHRLCCYVLVGYPRDSFVLAESRLRQVMGLGLTPMAMLWRDQTTWEGSDSQWRRFLRKFPWLGIG